MRYAMAGCFAIVMALQGCAGTPSVINKAEQQSLQSLQLFGPGNQPRFSFDLACTSEDISCSTVEHAFSNWAQDRNIAMQVIESDEDLLKPVNRSASTTTYRLAVHFAPLVAGSYNKINVRSGELHGNYAPPTVSYVATLYVFGTSSNKLLRTVRFHEQRTADFKADATGYIRGEVKNFILSLDPSYQDE
jgi:hypothetical protein